MNPKMTLMFARCYWRESPNTLSRRVVSGSSSNLSTFLSPQTQRFSRSAPSSSPDTAPLLLLHIYVVSPFFYTCYLMCLLCSYGRDQNTCVFLAIPLNHLVVTACTVWFNMQLCILPRHTASIFRLTISLLVTRNVLFLDPKMSIRTISKNVRVI